MCVCVCVCVKTELFNKMIFGLDICLVIKWSTRPQMVDSMLYFDVVRDKFEEVCDWFMPVFTDGVT